MVDLNKVEPRIFNLIDKGEIDPWDIDIIRLCGLYLTEVKAKRDLRISGNALLTAAVLLKFKSKIFDQKEMKNEELKPELAVPDIEIIPVSRSVKRKVTVFELLDALKDAFDLEKQRVNGKKSVPDVKFYANNISDSIEKIIEKLPSEIIMTSLGAVTFFAILHLAMKGVIEIEQEEWNGNIRVRKMDRSSAIYGRKAG